MDPAARPFCSDRCRLADLGRWLSEDYRVPDRATEHPTTTLPTDRDEDPDREQGD